MTCRNAVLCNNAAVTRCSSEDRRGNCRIRFRAASELAGNPETASVRQRPEGGVGLCLSGCASEGQLEAQLNLPRGAVGCVNQTCAGDSSAGRARCQVHTGKGVIV